jgi:hypothetical protein
MSAHDHEESCDQVIMDGASFNRFKFSDQNLQSKSSANDLLLTIKFLM